MRVIIIFILSQLLTCAAELEWPYGSFSEVRIRSITSIKAADLERATSSEALRHQGVKLTTSETQRFLSSIFQDRLLYPMAACFDPKFEALFFDSEGHIVGQIDICFQCRGIRTSPGLNSEKFTMPDWYALAVLFQSTDGLKTEGIGDPEKFLVGRRELSEPLHSTRGTHHE